MSTPLMKEVETEAGDYAAAFERLRENPSRFPAWIEDLRRRALEQFEAVGFPTVKEEDYRYTNIAPIANGEFQPTIDFDETRRRARRADISSLIYDEARGSRLVFVNNVFSPELSSTEAVAGDIVVEDLAEAIHGEHAAMIKNFLARGAETSGDDAFTSLNTAFMTSGAFVLLPKNTETKMPIHLLFLTDATMSKVATFPRVLVIAEPHSRATIIEEHKALNEDAAQSYFSSSVVEIYVDDEAHIVHYKVQREAENAFHVARTRAEVGRASTYNSTTINLGAGFTRHNINMNLRGAGSESWIDGLFFGQGTQFADTHSLINHREPHCTSHQSYKGVLNDKARSVFNGRIFVHQAAQKTDAYQSNKNLILSDQARVDTKPQLEIFADDVKCSHGATVGQINLEELFYLTSRGVKPELARNLLTYGFAEQVVQKIEVESIKRQLDEVILNRLHTTLDA